MENSNVPTSGGKSSTPSDLSVSAEDILRDLEGNRERLAPDDAYTMNQWRDKLNIGRERCRTLINDAVKAGKMEVVRELRLNEGGQLHRRKLYRWVSPDERATKDQSDS